MQWWYVVQYVYIILYKFKYIVLQSSLPDIWRTENTTFFYLFHQRRTLYVYCHTVHSMTLIRTTRGTKASVHVVSPTEVASSRLKCKMALLHNITTTSLTNHNTGPSYRSTIVLRTYANRNIIINIASVTGSASKCFINGFTCKLVMKCTFFFLATLKHKWQQIFIVCIAKKFIPTVS